MKLFILKIFNIIFLIAIGYLAFDALSIMLFNSLGTTPESSSWNYVLLLYFFIAIIGVINTLANTKSNLQFGNSFKPVAAILSVTLSFALLGFYYGGSISKNDPQIAAITAILLGLLGTILSLRKNQLAINASGIVATLAAYSFAFYAGTNAAAYLSLFKWFEGILWSVICWLYIQFTIANFNSVRKNYKNIVY